VLHSEYQANQHLVDANATMTIMDTIDARTILLLTPPRKIPKNTWVTDPFLASHPSMGQLSPYVGDR
jgi:hypothetical protein